MNICIISGSSRMGSNTLKVAKAIRNLLNKNYKINFIDFQENDFPSIGRKKIDKTNLTNFQRNFANFFKDSHLIIFCIPEYNWTTNPEVINVLHQIGSKEFMECFENKVFAIVGVSTGLGGRRPAIEITTLLNKIISFMGAIAIVSPLILESHKTEENISFDGNFLNKEIENKFINFLDYTLKITKKWHNLS